MRDPAQADESRWPGATGGAVAATGVPHRHPAAAKASGSTLTTRCMQGQRQARLEYPGIAIEATRAFEQLILLFTWVNMSQPTRTGRQDGGKSLNEDNFSLGVT